MFRQLVLVAAMTMAAATEATQWNLVVSDNGVLPAASGRWWKIDGRRDGPGSVPVVVLAPDPDRSRLDLVSGSGIRPQADQNALADPATIAMLNAGYFDSDHKPVGWRVAAGVPSGTSDAGSACTGFAWIDDAGRLRLSRRADGLPAAAVWGVQAGPFLIDPGGSHGITRDGGPAARRSVIATTVTGLPLFIAIDHPLTLTASADLLLVLPQAIGLPSIDAALNMDGGPSTTLAVPTLHLTIPARGPVIDVWRISAR